MLARFLLISMICTACYCAFAADTNPSTTKSGDFDPAERAYAAGEFELALDLYTRAAKAGNTKAMTKIGGMHEDGKGTSKNPKLAMRWYEEAAKRGDATAMHRIGLLFDFGIGVPKSYDLAKRWYEQAELHGYVSSTAPASAKAADNGAGFLLLGLAPGQTIDQAASIVKRNYEVYLWPETDFGGSTHLVGELNENSADYEGKVYLYFTDKGLSGGDFLLSQRPAPVDLILDKALPGARLMFEDEIDLTRQKHFCLSRTASLVFHTVVRTGYERIQLTVNPVTGEKYFDNSTKPGTWKRKRAAGCESAPPNASSRVVLIPPASPERLRLSKLAVEGQYGTELSAKDAGCLTRRTRVIEHSGYCREEYVATGECATRVEASATTYLEIGNSCPIDLELNVHCSAQGVFKRVTIPAKQQESVAIGTKGEGIFGGTGRYYEADVNNCRLLQAR
jgi:hypothetical protein